MQLAVDYFGKLIEHFGGDLLNGHVLQYVLAVIIGGLLGYIAAMIYNKFFFRR